MHSLIAFFLLNPPPTTAISTLSLHDALPILQRGNILEWDQPLTARLDGAPLDLQVNMEPRSILYSTLLLFGGTVLAVAATFRSEEPRLNSSHQIISYAVFCLKKKKR